MRIIDADMLIEKLRNAIECGHRNDMPTNELEAVLSDVESTAFNIDGVDKELPVLVRDFLQIFDGRFPYWINDGDYAYRYDEDTIPFDSETMDREILYITFDGNGELTIEI